MNNDLAFVSVLFLLALVMLVGDIVILFFLRLTRRSTLRLKELVDEQYADIQQTKIAIKDMQTVGDQLADALIHNQGSGPVAAFKSAAALAEWQKVRNG